MIMMIGFANHTFNELYSFGPVTANIFRKMIGLPEAQFSKDEEDDKSYLRSSNNIKQNHNTNQSNILFAILWFKWNWSGMTFASTLS
jgi:hypothetical protein